ncbi:exodeoxyribonuclease V subunit gamma, partial [bacterium]|nr:exodeoxyribonuclease V subunit gamma [candidate division CSSED10-310 bacterium]
MHIFFGPPGDSTVTEWFHDLPDDPGSASGTLWLTPTQRRRAWVTDRFRRAHRRFPPRILTFDEMIRILYTRLGGQRRIIHPAALHYLLLDRLQQPELQSALKPWIPQIPGPGFLQEVTRQIDELQRSGIGPEELAAIPDATDDVGAVFVAVYRDWSAMLDRMNVIDTGGLHRETFRLLSESMVVPDVVPRFLPWTRCIIDGFLELTPLQLNVLSLLSPFVHLTLVWPGNPSGSGMFQWFVAGLRNAFPGAEWTPLADRSVTPSSLAQAAFILGGMTPDILPGDLPPMTGGNTLRVMESETGTEEIIAIARDIKRRLLDGTCRPSDIAVTFPDLRTVAPLIRRIFHRYEIPVNISQSLPLTGSPVFHAIDRLLRTADGWLIDDVLAVLGDPVLTGWPLPLIRSRVRKMVEWSSHYRLIRGWHHWIAGLRRIVAETEPESPDNLAAAAVLET